MADRTFDESCYTTGQQRVAQRFLFLRSNIDIGGRHIVIVAWGNYGTDFAIKGGNNLWYVVQPYLFKKEKKSWYVEWSYYDVWWRIDWMTESRSYHATCCHSRASHPVEHTLSTVFQPLPFSWEFCEWSCSFHRFWYSMSTKIARRWWVVSIEEYGHNNFYAINEWTI